MMRTMAVDSFTLPARSSLLAAIALLLAFGVLTGAQLGKVAPLIPWYQVEFGLSLVAAGWLAALLGIFIALVALPAGWAIDRIGIYRSILVGALFVLLGGVGLALAAAPALIFAARLVEAVGYLSLCIALPAMLNDISPPSWKGPVLAIWSAFVPFGFAISNYLAAAMLPSASPQSYLLVMILLFAVLAATSLLVVRSVPSASAPVQDTSLRSTFSLPIVLIAVGFGAFVVLSVSMFTFMPAFVAGAGAHYLVSAGTVALLVPLGNVLAGVLVGGRGVSFMGRLAVAGFAVSLFTALPAFTSGDPTLATISAILLAVSGALVASAQFAAIPFLTPHGGSVPVALGLVCQAGGIGTLFGPPIAGAVIEMFGWGGLGWFLTSVAAVGLVSMIPLTRHPTQSGPMPSLPAR
jgi:MFS family permease